MTKTYLIFSAHPDDLDFGCSGTVAKLVEQGNKVVYCIISDGRRGGHKAKIPKKEIIKVRQREQREAAGILGVKRVIFLKQGDGEVENTKSLKRKLVRIIRKVKPDVVLSFDPASLSFDSFYRYHRDHREAALAVFDALYPAAGSPDFFPELKLKPHTIEEAWFFAAVSPDLWMNISGTLEKKIKALLAHRSQILDKKQLREKITDWAREAGRKKKMKYAEAFRRLIL